MQVILHISDLAWGTLFVFALKWITAFGVAALVLAIPAWIGGVIFEWMQR